MDLWQCEEVGGNVDNNVKDGNVKEDGSVGGSVIKDGRHRYDGTHNVLGGDLMMET